MSVRIGAVGIVVRYVLLALLLLAPAWFPLTRPGLPETTAGALPVLKLQAIERNESPPAGALADRWRGEGPWTYVVARSLRSLNANGVTAVKFGAGLALLVLSMAVGAWTALQAGARAGVLAAVLAGLAPPALGAVYGTGDVAALWTASGLALAGLGLQLTGRLGWFLAGAGSLVAAAALPGLGMWTAGALVIIALVLRRWTGLAAVLAGTVVGLIWSAPWTRPVLAADTSSRLHLFQLLAPGWNWNTDSLGMATPAPVASNSLGLALLGLLLIAIWLLAGRFSRSVRPWLTFLGLGLLFVLMSLLVPEAHLPLLAMTAGAPGRFLLPALPLLTVVAASSLRFLPELRQQAIWSSVLLVTVLAAVPYLPSAFISVDIPDTPVAEFGDGQVLLLHLDREGTLTPGADVTVHADWLALRPPAFDYNIFLHAVDTNGVTHSQVDIQPVNGERPMTTWRTGEIISDSYKLSIPKDAPQDLHLSLGLYNWQTQERLPTGGGDSLNVP